MWPLLFSSEILSGFLPSPEFVGMLRCWSVFIRCLVLLRPAGAQISWLWQSRLVDYADLLPVIISVLSGSPVF